MSGMMEEKKILLETDTLEYCLNCMTGRLGMVPYLSKIKRMLDNKTKDDLLEINYLKIFKSNAKSNILGAYERIRIVLQDSSLNLFS
jgi:hypothetical protein